MKIKSIRIISNALCYGPAPKRDDEVQQRLTITSAGEVSCSRYLYGDGGDRELKGEEEVSIGKEAASEILEYIGKFVETYQPAWMTDVGSWEMEVTYEDGEKTELTGALIGTQPVEDVDLSEMIREEVPIKNLFVFDGGC